MSDAAEIQSFFDAVCAGDRAALEARAAEDVVLEFPGGRFGGRYEGRRHVLVFLAQVRRMFRGDLVFDLAWVGRAGDRTVAQWTNRGTTRDGCAYQNRGVTIFVHGEGGLIAEIHDYLDTERMAAAWPS